MSALLIAVFVLTYLAIALEEPTRVNKSAVALVGAGLLWTIYALGFGNAEAANEELAETLIETAQIAFFLIGAMTIVEVVDAHDGFEVITSRMRARTLAGLATFMAVMTFFLSAILDNLTTTIVMVSLLSKLLRDRSQRLYLAGIIVIAANAGGAWSPIGDVTTTMLWIGGQITASKIVTGVFVPSLINLAVPLAYVAWVLRGQPIVAPDTDQGNVQRFPRFERNLMFFLGLAALISVPVFKAVTHLPPFLGVLFGLGILWTVGDLLHRKKDKTAPDKVTIAEALTRIDMSAIVFFIGILLAVATLQHAGILGQLARLLEQNFGRLDVIVVITGLISAIVDNVPMVAAAMGMYDIAQYPQDSFLWEFLAYCAGTGGSILIIGSAAGVAAMSIQKIEFMWYARRFGPMALAGYFAGAITYLIQYRLFG